MTRMLIVEGVSRETPEWILEDHFRCFGYGIVSVHLTRQGHAIVTMANETSARAVIKSRLQGGKLCGRPLKIRLFGTRGEEHFDTSSASLAGEAGSVLGHGPQHERDSDDLDDLAQEMSRMEIRFDEGKWRKIQSGRHSGCYEKEDTARGFRYTYEMAKFNGPRVLGSMDVNNHRYVLFVLFNPPDESEHCPTIDKLRELTFGDRKLFGQHVQGFKIVNLFEERSSDPNKVDTSDRTGNSAPYPSQWSKFTGIG